MVSMEGMLKRAERWQERRGEAGRKIGGAPLVKLLESLIKLV